MCFEQLLTRKPALISVNSHRGTPFVGQHFIQINQNRDCRPYERCAPCINRIINESALVFVATHQKRRAQRSEKTYQIIIIVLCTSKHSTGKGYLVITSALHTLNDITSEYNSGQQQQTRDGIAPKRQIFTQNTCYKPANRSQRRYLLRIS